MNLRKRRLAVFSLLLLLAACGAAEAAGWAGRQQGGRGFASAANAGDMNSEDQARAMSLLREAARVDQTGDVGGSLKLLREAAALENVARDARIMILQKLGAAETQAGNLREALAAREQASKLTGLGSDLPGKHLVALTHQADLQLKLGDNEAAKKTLAEAEQTIAIVRSKRNWINYGDKWSGGLEMVRGELARAEGRYADAEAAFRKSLAAFEAFRAHGATRGSDDDVLFEGESAERSVESALSYLVNILQLQGRLAEAELYARQLLTRAQARQGGHSFSTGRGHRMLSMILAERGRYVEAEAEARAALADLQGSGALPFSFNMVRSQQALGVALAGAEKWEQAAAAFRQAREVTRDNLMPDEQFGLGNPYWALTLIRVGQPQRAAAMLQKMLAKQVALQPETALRPALTRGLLGMAQYAAGQEELAEASFRTAVPAMLANLHQLDGEDEGTSASASMIRRIVDAYVDLLMQRHQAGRGVPNGKPLDLAFRYADMASAGSVSRALASSAARSALGDAGLADKVRREQELSQRIRQYDQTVERLSGMRDAQLVQDSIAALRKQIEEARTARARLHDDIMRHYPAYAGLIDPQAPGLNEIAGMLKPDEAFVSIHPTESRTYIWAIRAGEAPASAIVGLSEKDLAQAVDHLRKALDPGDVSLAQLPAFDVDAAQRLYAQLFGPIEKSLTDADRLILVTTGPLGRLPFGLLVTGAPPAARPAGKEMFAAYRNVPWLVRRFAITNLPSVANFPALRRNRAPSAKLAFAGFGDPLFSTDQTSAASRTRGASQLRKLALIKSSAPTDSGQPGTVPNEMAMLPQLPETRDEILAMAKVLHADVAHDVFLEANASEAAVRRADLADRRVVAFSTHGLVPGELSGLDSPALALSAPELAALRDPDDTGFLTLEKILPLKLNADLVVLSACNTAAGQGAGAEAFSGLGRAFFFAGARSVLVSHWPVESQATEELISATLRNYANDPSDGRAEALRRAELELIDGKTVEYDKQKFSLAHPLFWAAFSLVGEGGAQ